MGLFCFHEPGHGWAVLQEVLQCAALAGVWRGAFLEGVGGWKLVQWSVLGLPGLGLLPSDSEVRPQSLWLRSP